MRFETIRNFYDKGYYSKEQVLVFVPRYITQEQYGEITK